MEDILNQLRGDPATNAAILAVVALAVLDFITGTARAIADKTFEISLIDVWVRKTLLGRVLTIVLVLGFGRFVGSIAVGDTSLGLLTLAGLAAAGTYAATALASILANLNPSATNALPVE